VKVGNFGKFTIHMRVINILFLFYTIIAIAPQAGAQLLADKILAVAFYNCENFFDTTDNPAKNDDEFTPAGRYRYTGRIYKQKLHNIADVIESFNDARGAALIGFAEVENDQVLAALVKEPKLARHKYRYVWYDGPDPRGINVALMYDPAVFTVNYSEPVTVDISGTGGKSVTRDILHVNGKLAGKSVDVFVNHWPSRRGGVTESYAKRAIAAKANKQAATAALKRNKNTRVIIMGDLNDNPADRSVSLDMGATAAPQDAVKSGFYNPFAGIYASGSGTEVYKHKWNLFDQIIISANALQNNGLHFESAAIHKPAFICDTYKGHVGEPHRSFRGTYWINGYSDHYPVVMYLSVGR
jgi:hypothetical protein